jgi:hypothetical protein
VLPGRQAVGTRKLSYYTNKMNINELTFDELFFAYLAIKNEQEQAIDMLAQHQFIGTDPQHKQVKFWEKQVEISIQWMVHLELVLENLNRKENRKQ